MTDKVLNAILQVRNDTAANWTSKNPVLLKGELGIDTNSKKIKIGNGTNAWNDLPYFNSYTIEELSTPDENCSATYVLKDENNNQIGDKINIPSIDGKLDILPKVDDPNDPGFGWEYHIPYSFDAVPDAEKLNITLKTLTLDNKWTKMNFDKALPGATTTTAGLMTAADKVKLNSALTAHQSLTEYAKKSDVTDAISELIDGAPEALNTLKELADAVDGVATQAWVEAQGYLTEAPDPLPEGTEAGQALIYNGEEWSKQNGYGYELAPETNVSFNGNTTGLTKIETGYFPFYKLPYTGYLPSKDDLMGRTVYYIEEGSSKNSEWTEDDVQSSPEGTLELQKEDFANTIIIIYDDTTMTKYDSANFTKGIWVAKQDDYRYITDIYFGPVITQIDSKFIPSDDNKANVDDVVNLTEDQTIGGEKEFTSPIKFESGLSTTTFGQGGVSIGAFAQPTTKYNFATDGSDYVVDGEVTVASREWVEAQGYGYSAGDGISISEDNVISSSIQYIELTGLSGTMTEEQLAILNDNSSNYIYVDGKRYDFKDSRFGPLTGIVATYGTVYGTTSLTLDVITSTGAWSITATTLQPTLTAGTGISIVDNVISATGGGGSSTTADATLQSDLTVGIAVGGIAAGKVYTAGTSLESILRDLLTVSTPTGTTYIYKGVAAAIPTDVSGLTSVAATADTLTTDGYLFKNVNTNNEYVILAIDKSLGLECYQVNDVNGFSLGFDSSDLGDQMLYYISDPTTDTGARFTFYFKEAE